MPLPEEHANGFIPKTLPRRVANNGRGLLVYRSDYELRFLRIAERARRYWNRFLVPYQVDERIRERWEKDKTPEVIAEAVEAALSSVHLAQIASKELREWCERERILLRIPLPAAQKVLEPKPRGTLEPQRGLIVQEQPAHASAPLDVQSTTAIPPP